jgi:hypothetical protein
MKLRTLVSFAAWLSVPSLVLLAAPSLAGAARPKAPPVKLRFAPEEGSSVTKTFETKGSLALEQHTLEGAGVNTPTMEMNMTLHQKIVVTDTYAKNRENAPQRLIRSFDSLAAEQGASKKTEALGERRTLDQNMRATSLLEGKKVVFDWDAEKLAYTKAFDPQGEEEDLLEDLEEDMDLRTLLPAGEVQEGDEWELPLSGLRGLFAPGGNLALVPENSDREGMKMGPDSSSMSEMIGEKLEGTAKAKLVKIEAVDGVPCARIHIVLDVKSTADMTEAARKKLAGSEEAEGFEIDHLDVAFAFTGEGDLLWNMAAGRFHNLDLSGQMTIRNEHGIKLEVAGKKMQIEQRMTLSGSTSYSARAR